MTSVAYPSHWPQPNRNDGWFSFFLQKCKEVIDKESIHKILECLELPAIGLQKAPVKRKAGKILLREGLQVKLIPTPREFSSDCGIALRFDWRRSERTRELLESARVEISSIRSL